MSLMSTRVKPMQVDSMGEVIVAGSCVAPTQGAAAKASKALSSLGDGQWNATLEAKTAGAAGNAISVTCTASAALNAKAFLDMDAPAGGGTTRLNTILQFKTAGTGGNAWKVQVVPGPSGGDESVDENTVDKILTIVYESGVTTVTDVEALFPTTNFEVKTGGTGANILADPGDTVDNKSFAGGTGTCSISRSGTDFTVLYASTVATVAELNALITALAGDDDILEVAAAGTGGNVMGAGSAFAHTHLAGGAAATQATGYKGQGFSMSYVATGEYLVTFDHPHQALKSVKVFPSLATPADLKLQAGAWDDAAKTAELHSMTAAGVATDYSTNAGDRINIMAVFTDTAGR